MADGGRSAAQPGAAGLAPVACGVCGETVEEPPPLTWSTSHGPLGTTWYCGACTRTHLRAMEAQLDQEHW